MYADRSCGRAARAFWLPTLLLLCVAACGFNETLRGYGHNAAKGFADGIPEMKAPGKKLLRDVLLEGDTLKQASDQAVAAAVRSLSRELADSEVQKRVDGLIEHTLGVLAQKGGEATQSLLRTAGPELREALRSAVVHTMAEAGAALRDSMEKQIQPATEILARHTAEVLADSLVKALEGPLGKKLEQSAGQMGQHLVGEAAAALAAPASKAAVAEFTESATRGAIRGARAGVSEGLPQSLQTALIAGLIVLGALLILFGGVAFSLWHRYQQSTTTLAIIAEKINQASESEEHKALKQAIAQSASANHVGPWLSRFLKNRGL